MGEADAAVLDLDDAGPRREVEVVLGTDRGDRRRPQRRGRRQRPLDPGWEPPDPVANRLAERGGNRQRYPGLGLALALLQHPSELERVEGIAARRLVNPAQQRAREGDAEPGAQQTVEGADRDRTDADTTNAFGRYAIETEPNLRRVAHPPSQQEPDRPLEGASQRKLEQQRRRRVEPLDVVDRNDHRSVACQFAKSSEEADRDRPRLHRCIRNVVQKERGG
jgi:hypothetical protein